MTAFVPFGSTPLESDRLPDDQMYANDGEFVRGTRAGVYGMGSSLRNAAGAVADAFDFDNFAAQQYGEADRLAQKAGRVGPRISSLEQLKQGGYSLGDIGDYAMGTMGSALPSMGVGLGATLASGGAALPSMLAATAAYTPMEMGDAVAKWRGANPGEQIDGGTALRLGATGLASAGAQSIVPAMVGGKVMGRGLASTPVAGFKQAATRNLAEIPMEGFTEGLGEGIKQAGALPGQDLDWGQIGENTVAGMVGGAPMAGIGALGDYAHGNAGAVADAASRATKAVGKALEPAKGVAESAKTATEKGFGDAWTAMSDLGESAWKGFSDSDLGKTLNERVVNTQQRVQEILDDPEVPAEWKAKVEAAAKTAGNKTSAAIVAAVDATRNKVKQVREDGIRKATIDTLRDSVDAVINNDYLGNKADLANGSDEQISSRLRESAKKAVGAAKTWAEDLLRRPDVDDADKAEINDAMGNPDDPTGPQRVAAKWKLYDAKDRMVKGFQDIKTRFKKGLDSASEDPGAPKKSEDYSGVRAVIGEALRPHMTRINEAVGKDPKALAQVADSLRTYIEAVTDVEGKKTDAVDRGFARMTLTQVLGDDAAGIMADVAEAVGRGQTREQTDRVFEELNELQALQRSHGDLVKMMTRALPKGQRNEVSRDIERVVEWATGADVRGKDASQNEIKFRNQKMELDLQKKYGAKAKAIMTQVEQMLSPKQGSRFDPEADRLAAEQDEVDYETALREEELQEESRFIGSGTNRKGLFVDPKIHAKNYPEEAAQGKGKGIELKRDVVDKEFPNGNVRFVSVAEDPTILDRSPSEKSAMTKKRKELEAELPGDENAPAREQALQEFREERTKQLIAEGRGMYRVDHSSHERLSVEEIDAMRMDTANFGNTDHPSRLEIKPEGSQRAAHVFDATRVTKEAMKRINREREWTKGDDIGQLTRMARAFSDGVTALMREYGRIKVTPDLVIGTINGKPVTAIEALKADKRTLKDIRTDAQTMEAVDIRKRLEQIGKELEGTGKETRKELDAEAKDLRGQLKYLENSRQGRINTDLAAKTIEDMEIAVRAIDKRLNGIGKAGEGKVDPERQRIEGSIRTMESLLDRTTDDTKRKDIETAITTMRQSLDGERNVNEREKLMKEREYLMGRLEGMYDEEAGTTTGGAYERAFADKQHQDGAREDADPTGNIHQAAARLPESELQVRQNVDGTTRTTPSTYVANVKPLVLVASRVREAGGIGEVLANRLLTLAKNFPVISEKDQRELLALQGASQPSAIGETVNRLARKYAGQLVAPGKPGLTDQKTPSKKAPAPKAKPTETLNTAATRHLEYLNNPPDDYTTERAQQIRTWAERQMARVNDAIKGVDEMTDQYDNLSDTRAVLRHLLKKTDSVLEGDASLKEMEGTPDPKAVAAKKAAFLERAASGDKALIKELQTSTDLKGLQRAVAALNEADTAPDVVQTINDRIRELVKDEGQAYHAQTRKYSLVGVAPGTTTQKNLDTRLKEILSERGITLSEAAFTDVPVEMRVSLVNRTLQTDPSQPMAQDVARFISWMTIGSEFYDRIAAGISGTKFEAEIRASVDRNVRTSLYSPPRKQREIVRQAVEQLLTNGIYKRQAEETALPARVLQIVREAIRHVITALGGVKYQEIQSVADQYIDDLLAGRVTLERERQQGVVLLDPQAALKNDPHAAGIIYTLAGSKQFTLTGSLAYAAQGTVYRPANAAIHDLDFVTPLSQRSAEERMERLFPWAEKVRSFGGMGDFVTTYVVPPRDHKISGVVQSNGVITAYTVRDDRDAVVGRYTNTDGKESSTGVKTAIVDLIGDPRQSTETMVIPTEFGDQRVSIAPAEHAMAQKLLYARNKDIQDFANFVPHNKDRKYSSERVDQQHQGSGPSEPLSAKGIREYLHRVLGDTVQLEFANLLYAGDFTRQDGEDIIRISVHALNPTTVAYHESLHAFFQQLKDKGLPDVAQAVFKGLNTPHIMRQLRERLKDSPEALAQLSDPEERAAYAYQFWASDPTFKLKPETRTVFEKIAAAIRKVLGIWSNDERALEIFKYFHSGKYQQQTASKLAIHTATMRAGRNSTVDTVAHMVKPLKKLGEAVVGAGGERLRDSGIPALSELADLIKLRGTDEGRDGGFIPAARLARTEHMNWLATHLKDYDQTTLNEALEAMQAGTKAGTAKARIVQLLVQKKFLREQMFDKYLPDAGVKLGDLGPDYFPRVWDSAYISKNQEAFVEMLQSYGVKNPETVVHKIVSGNGTEWGFDDNAQIEIERPGFVNTRERKMAFISGQDALPFLQKDFWKTMDSYVTQATRRGEWSRRFGYKNEKFDDLLGRAVRQGATEEQVEMARDFAKAVDGTLGDGIDPSYRRLMGNMIVYQNIRLLPMAIFSSLVDPLGVVVRGGTVRDGWDTFKRGIKELRKSWQKDPSFDADTMLAEQIGTIEDAMLQHTISSMYGQGMMGDGAQKINDLFFRYNLMEGFNRSMRVGATQAALGFIGRHAKGVDEHSKRYLAELGLKASDVTFNADGKVVIDERVKLAVNRWVDGAVLRPNAAETPIWMHDPHYALFAHLKQFAFAFHHTFLKRVWHEYQHGNYKPIMALASFVPMMMAADFVKDMLANGGDEPEWKRQWTFMDHVGYGVERAGVLGVGQFALDGIGDIRHGGTGIGALTGPTVDQLLDGVSMIGGRREFGSFALRSMPANALYRGYVGEADELEFEGDSIN